MTQSAAPITIRTATPENADAVTAIYNEGIADRVATFETREREPDEIAAWFEHDLPFLVAIDDDGTVLGFARVSPYSDHGRLPLEWKDCVLVERLLGAAAAQPARSNASSTHASGGAPESPSSVG